MSEPLLSVEAARDRVLAAIPGPLPVETHAPDTALGHVLALPVIAATDLPPWDNSAMDGYAIRAADVAAATEERPVRLAVDRRGAGRRGGRTVGRGRGRRSGSRPGRRCPPVPTRSSRSS